jgi:hypothetical protein
MATVGRSKLPDCIAQIAASAPVQLTNTIERSTVCRLAAFGSYPSARAELLTDARLSKRLGYVMAKAAWEICQGLSRG